VTFNPIVWAVEWHADAGSVRLNLFCGIFGLVFSLEPEDTTNYIAFDVRKSVHHHTIQINQPTRCNNFTSLLLDVYVWFNMFWAPLRPSLGAYNCTRSLWFYHWSVAVGALLVVVCQTAPSHTLPDNVQ